MIKNSLIRPVRLLLLLCLLCSGLTTIAFPLYKMSSPIGNYPIGTVTFDTTDPIRKELYTDDPEDYRKIRIQLWYPSDSVEGFHCVPWLQDGTVTAAAITSVKHLPNFLLSHTALIRSNSYQLAPVSKKQISYPVIIISHGWTGFRNLHTDVAELLASNGYIVASIDHTYGAAVTAFDNGQIAYLKSDDLLEIDTTKEFLAYANTLINTFSDDILLTIDELNRINTGDLDFGLEGKLDLSKIGLLGHSTGGGAGVATALKDSRIKAILGLDAWVEPIKKADIKAGLHVPALFLRSEAWEEAKNNNKLYWLINRDTDYAELYQINGMTHLDFTMIYMYSPFSKYFGFTGQLNGWKGAQIQHEFELNFFNQYLKNQPDAADASTIAAEYNEVEKIK